jgi:hypothetical protein
MTIATGGYAVPLDAREIATGGYGVPNVRDVSNTAQGAATFNGPAYAESDLAFRRKVKYG